MGRLAIAAITLVGLLAPGAACADAPTRTAVLSLERVAVEDGGDGRFSGIWTYATPRKSWKPTGRHTYAVRLGRCTARVGVAATAKASAPGSGQRLVEQATREPRALITQGDGWRVVRANDEDGAPQLVAVVARRAEGARWSLLQVDAVTSRRCRARQLRSGALPRALAALVRDAKLDVGD